MPIQTVWVLLERKSNTQLQSVALKSRVLCFPISFIGERCGVLISELKSTNSTLIYVLLLSRWMKTKWRAVDMALSVDLLVLNAYWIEFRLAGVFYFL